MPEGRQSPEPETQTGEQIHDLPGSGKANAAPSSTHAQEKSDESKNKSASEGGLESNPVHPLQANAESKVAKNI